MIAGSSLNLEDEGLRRLGRSFTKFPLSPNLSCRRLPPTSSATLSGLEADAVDRDIWGLLLSIACARVSLIAPLVVSGSQSLE